MTATRTRSAVAVAALAITTGLAVVAAPAATADQPTTPPTQAQPGQAQPGTPPGQAQGGPEDDGLEPELPDQASATAALATAERVLDGEAVSGDPEPTIALRNLRHSLGGLPADARARAEALLPSSGGEQESHRGSNQRMTCGPHVCVHYTDNPTSRNHTTEDWALRTRDALEHVWSVEVGTLGYKRPLRDGDTRGRLDVNLRDLGDGVYGYCAPTNGRRVAPGACTLDNDYSADQYTGTPETNLQVTAAHEFFHAVQFGYDAWEDPWLMEASSTWMEERVYDRVDDNRQYLRAGQLHKPGRSLDLFPYSGYNYYGNWIWFEHLSSHYGRGIVKRVWNRVGDRRGMPNEYSIEALRAVLRDKGGFRNVYARFAGANTHPASAYPEGSTYARPAPAARTFLGGARQRWSGSFRIDHQASQTVRAVPVAALGRAKLRVRIDGPARRTSPAAAVTVLRNDGSVSRRLVELGRKGNGGKTVSFRSDRVRDVSVTPVNASTRYRWCNQGDGRFGCNGFPRDQRKKFEVRLAVRR